MIKADKATVAYWTSLTSDLKREADRIQDIFLDENWSPEDMKILNETVLVLERADEYLQRVARIIAERLE